MNDVPISDPATGDSRRPRYYGKYRGKVVNNFDPLMLGRIMASVPAVPMMEMNWCMPCTPYAGSGVGFYAIPPIGANVWIEFEGGDPSYPIWVGCFWAPGQVPVVAGPPNPFIKVLKTETAMVLLNDTPAIGGITIECIPPAVVVPLTMKYDAQGITVTAPPASLKMIIQQGITLFYPPDTITMTVMGIKSEVPASSVEITPTAVTTTTPEIKDTTATGISMTAGTDVKVTAGAGITTMSGMATSATAGAGVSVTSAADFAVTAPLIRLN